MVGLDKFCVGCKKQKGLCCTVRDLLISRLILAKAEAENGLKPNCDLKFFALGLKPEEIHET
jgi:hypothetical protein